MRSSISKTLQALNAIAAALSALADNSAPPSSDDLAQLGALLSKQLKEIQNDVASVELMLGIEKLQNCVEKKRQVVIKATPKIKAEAPLVEHEWAIVLENKDRLLGIVESGLPIVSDLLETLAVIESLVYRKLEQYERILAGKI